jgi:uncharacterized protein (DUF697 family)
MMQTEIADTKMMRRERRADAIIRRNMMWAMGAGLIPIPFLDSAVVITLQVKMLGELSECYGTPFHASSAKAAISALVCGLAGETLGRTLLGTGAFSVLARSIPVLGFALSALTMPTLHGALTYALGKVFQQHFAAGGTILMFNPQKTESFFRAKFEEGLKTAASAPSIS